ncbi:unnamed protein product [Sphagnum tenellum]
MQPISYNIKRISTKKKAHLVARPVYRIFKTGSAAAADRQRQTDLERRRVKTRRDAATTKPDDDAAAAAAFLLAAEHQEREKKGSVLVPRFGTSFRGLHLPFLGLFRGLSRLGISNAR